MEKFKACEKEMKTKAFSKEGLIQAAKLDPEEQKKEEATSWLQTQVEELQMQVEQAEAEIEALQGAGKKRNKAGSSAAGRLEELEHLNERRKWHISRLEIVLRLLNNGSLSTDRIDSLREDVQYFVESNQVRFFVLGRNSQILNTVMVLRKKTSTRTKAYMMNSTLTRKKRSSVWLQMMMKAMNRTALVKVCRLSCLAFVCHCPHVDGEDLPPRTPKKHDEESVTSSKRDDSPILKKAAVTLQLRSMCSHCAFISCLL